MKRTWLVVLLIVPVLLLSAPVVFAAKTFPSVAGDWLAEGTMTAKLCVKKYGCERASEPFYGNISFYEDHSLALDSEIVGQWSQSKSKVTAELNIAEIESMLNEILYEEVGEGIDLDITSMAFKAKLAKDGSRMSNGKLYIKFEFIFDYYGEIIEGKGNIATKFTGVPAISGISRMATESNEEQDMAPALVRLISTLLADHLLPKLKM